MTTEQRQEAAKKAAETRKRNAERREAKRQALAADKEEQLAALRAVRDDPKTEPADRVKAVELIEMVKRLYG